MDSSPPLPPPDSPAEVPLSTLEALSLLPGDGRIPVGSVAADTLVPRVMPVGANIRPYLVNDPTNPMDAQDRPAEAAATGTVPPAALQLLKRHDLVVEAFKTASLKPHEDPAYKKIVMDALIGHLGTFVTAAGKDTAADIPTPAALKGILGGSLAAQAALAEGLSLDDDLAGEPG